MKIFQVRKVGGFWAAVEIDNSRGHEVFIECESKAEATRLVKELREEYRAQMHEASKAWEL